MKRQRERFGLYGIGCAVMSKACCFPGGTHLCTAYGRFTKELPDLCGATKLDEANLTYTDFNEMVAIWLRTNS